jgi:diacylglycerol kinase family enzyme
MSPAVDARPDDGILDLYLVRAVPWIKLIGMALDYIRGFYYKWPHSISHFRGKIISISSDQIMSICIDGEMFYDSVIDYEVIPRAVDFACPIGIDRSAPAGEPLPAAGS